MKYLITTICILLETALFIFNIGDIGVSLESASAYKNAGICFAIINLLIGLLMLGISIDSMRRIKNRQKAIARQAAYLIGLGIIWAGNLAITSVCTDFADGDCDVVIGAVVMILAGLAIVIPTGVLNYRKASLSKQEKINVRRQKGDDVAKRLMEQSYFTYENAEWYYEEAFKEYCMMHGLTSADDLEQHMPRLIGIGDLTEEEKDRLWDYAGLHMGYLLTWIASRGLLSDELNETLDNPLEAMEISQHSKNGLELLSQMDYKISSQDLGAGEAKEAFEYRPGYRRTYEMDQRDGFIHKFLGCYINGMAPLGAYLYRDMPELIMKDGVQYCQDFSWGTYDRIAELLNRKYDYFVYCEEQAHIEDSFPYPEEESETSNMAVYTIENERWQLDFQVYARPDVNDEYKDKVIRSLKEMPLTLQREIAKKILEVYYDDYARDFMAAMPADKTIKRTAGHTYSTDPEERIGDAMDRISRDPEELFMYDELFGCLQLHIYAPREESITAYVITCESLLEEEHGISISVFDGHVLEVGYWADLENPWVTNRDFAITA